MKRSVRRKPGGRPDPLERDIEMALRPCVFIPDRVCFSFVGNLEDVAGGIAGLIAGGPTRAVTLYETFLAACYEKASEVDDSSGNFGQFVEGLFLSRDREERRQGVRQGQAGGLRKEGAGAVRCSRGGDDLPRRVNGRQPGICPPSLGRYAADDLRRAEERRRIRRARGGDGAHGASPRRRFPGLNGESTSPGRRRTRRRAITTSSDSSGVCSTGLDAVAKRSKTPGPNTGNTRTNMPTTN